MNQIQSKNDSNYKEKKNNTQSISFRSIFQDMVLFFSIIMAYLWICVSYEHSQQIEQFLGIDFSHLKFPSYIILLFSLHFILLKTVSWIIQYRSGSQISKIGQQLDKFMMKSIHWFLSFFFISAYIYILQINKSKKQKHFVQIKHLSLLAFWFFLSNVLQTLGKFTNNILNIQYMEILGQTIEIIVFIKSVCIANGYNTFLLL